MGYSKELFHDEGIPASPLAQKNRLNTRDVRHKLPEISKNKTRRSDASFAGWSFQHLRKRYERLQSAARYRIDVMRSQIFDRKNLLKAAIVVVAYLLIVRQNAPDSVVVGDQNPAYVLNVAETAPISQEGGAFRSGGAEVSETLMPEPTRIAEPIISAVKSVEAPQRMPKMKAAEKPATPQNANPHAPVSHNNLMTAEVKAYIERFAPVAVAEMKKYGIPASISLAQGLVESRAGTSKLAVKNNNHFGIKCFSKNCAKGHCTNHEDDTHKDFFRKFNTGWESWRAHSIMISSGRYAKLKKHGRDYKKWANGLQEVGYATDKGYARKLIEVIERYNLQRYDR